jgi:hypothetical protein
MAGRPRNFETPDDLYQLFVEYRKYVKDNPRYSYALSNKTGKAEPIPLEPPLTISGFRVFCHDKGLVVNDYFANTDGRYSAFATICTRISDEIRNDQIQGGMVGQFNASITQRLNGLTEKTDITSGGQTISEVKVNIIKPTE